MKKNAIITVLIAALVVCGIWGFNQNKTGNNYKTNMLNSYNENFASLTENVRDISARLSKIKASNDLSYIKQELMYLYSLSNSCEDDLKSLPVSQSAIKDTASFFNKCSNYYLALFKKIDTENKIDDEDIKNLNNINDSTLKMSDKISSLNDYMFNSKDGFNWQRDDENWYFSTNEDDKLNLTFSDVKEGEVEYPKLIYDGAFSDDLRAKSAKGLEGKDFSKEEAKKVIETFLKDNKLDYSVEYVTSTKNSIIDCYIFNLKSAKEEFRAHISKKGAKLISLTSNLDISEEEKLSAKDAKKKALDFVKKLRKDNMEVTYYETKGNVATYNLAYNLNGITCYPDLIKVKVRLDTGEITGYEASNYYISHIKRNVKKAKLSENEAKKKVNKNLKVTKTRLAYIPLDNGKERLCYEFKGTIGKEIFLIYIDADTGEEKEILKVIEADESILTM